MIPHDHELGIALNTCIVYHVPMNTTAAAIRGNRPRISDEVSQAVTKLPAEHRRYMKAIATHKHWPESEAFRDAVRMYLREHRDLIQVLCPDGVCPNGR